MQLQLATKYKKPPLRTDWKSEVGGWRSGSSSACRGGAGPGSACLCCLPLTNQLRSMLGLPLFWRWPSGATWLSASSKNFHRTCSHLLFGYHWSRIDHSPVQSGSQARPLGFLLVQSSLPLESSQGLKLGCCSSSRLPRWR